MRRQTVAVVGGVVLMAGVMTGSAMAAKPTGPTRTKKPTPTVTHEHHFSDTLAGSRLSTTGNRFEDVFRIKRSPFGEGSMIFDGSLKGTSFPATGTATSLMYDRGGKTFSTDTFTLGSPNVDGAGTISGKGSCVKSKGTAKHLDETCTFTFTGSYNLITGLTYMSLTGTYTTSSKASTAAVR